MTSLSQDNLTLLEERERLHVENVQQTVHPVVQDAIARGEMGKLASLLQLYSGIDGLLEYSLFDSKGEVAFSTVPITKPKKTLPADLQGRLLSDPSQFARRTEQAFEIYHPVVVTKKCLECHDNMKEGAVGAVAVLRCSTAALAQSRENWVQSLDKLQKMHFRYSAAATVIIGLVLVILAYLVVRWLVAIPVQRIIGHLESGVVELNSSSAEIASASRALAEGAS